ncbi:tubby-like F-box protein 2 [Silene latifolia]|uniref:tubby-like F-box protein 2 n=1 Tax=Silene latifolia TaxID=37657 RepID=UPI003D76C773
MGMSSSTIRNPTVKEMKDRIGNLLRRGGEGKFWRGRSRSHIAPDQATQPDEVDHGQWANLPPELLLDIIRRVEVSETTWPARSVVVFCAAVCRSWREVTKEIVQTPEQCGKLTFPISLKQPGPHDNHIQCFIKRDRATSTFRLFYGLTPSEDEKDKLLLAARKIRKATSTDFVVSLVADDFSRCSTAYVGKLRSNFLGTKFTIYDSQPPCDAAVKTSGRPSRRFHSKQVSSRLPACNYSIATISYELNVLRTRVPRRLHCVIHSIPLASIQEGGTSPTPKAFPHLTYDKCPPAPPSPSLPRKEDQGLTSNPTSPPEPTQVGSRDRLMLKNKSPRWHEQLQCWCLNFKGRVTVASVKNFQLVAAIEPHHDIPASKREKVILQFGKIGKDIFTMDYRYPLSAFQAFAICLSSFDTKPVCE